MRRLAFPGVALALSALLPAQFTFLNGRVPNATVIDWYGVPALFTVAQGGTPLFTTWQVKTGPRLELQVLATAAMDLRPCAFRNSWAIGFDDFAISSGPSGSIGMTGIGIGGAYLIPLYAASPMNNTEWGIAYAWQVFCRSACGPNDCRPEWGAIIYLPVIR